MNFNENLPDKRESVSEDSEEENTLSIDEFFRQLEMREKDLHITETDTVIEIDEADVEPVEEYIPGFLKRDLEEENKAVKPSSSLPKPVTSVSANLENQMANLQNRLAKLETERGEMIELARRRQNDFESYKKRVERDRGETFRNQLGNLAKQLLPVLDNLNRALDAASGCGEDAQNFQHLFEGIMLVNQQLGEVLEEMGVQPIATVGESFDPYYHEAVATEKSDGVPPNTITGELLRGYKIDDKVIRASMVKVST